MRMSLLRSDMQWRKTCEKNERLGTKPFLAAEKGMGKKNKNSPPDTCRDLRRLRSTPVDMRCLQRLATLQTMLGGTGNADAWQLAALPGALGGLD